MMAPRPFSYPGLFIVGTDTGVGKTYIGGTIGAALRGRGQQVGVMKPVESGCPRVAGELAAALFPVLPLWRPPWDELPAT